MSSPSLLKKKFNNVLIIKKLSASSWLLLINKYIEMHGQQNIKKKNQTIWQFNRRPTVRATKKNHRGADKSLARPGRKQSDVSVRMAWISFCALPCTKINLMTARVSMLLKSRASLTCFRACFRPDGAKDLSAPRENWRNNMFSFFSSFSRTNNGSRPRCWVFSWIWSIHYSNSLQRGKGIKVSLCMPQIHVREWW